MPLRGLLEGPRADQGVQSATCMHAKHIAVEETGKPLGGGGRTFNRGDAGDAMLGAAVEKTPGIFKFCSLSYSRPSELIYNGYTLHFREGTQQ